jgi:subtilisin family serine protease
LAATKGVRILGWHLLRWRVLERQMQRPVRIGWCDMPVTALAARSASWIAGAIGVASLLPGCSKHVPGAKPTDDAGRHGSAAITRPGATVLPGQSLASVQVDKHRPEKFATDRAVLNVLPTLVANPPALAELLKKLDLQPFGPPSFDKPLLKLNPKAPDLRRRSLAPRTAVPLLVSLPQASLPSTAEVDLMLRRDYPTNTITFGSDSAKRHFGYILKHKSDGGARLAPAFAADQTGLFKSEEGRAFAGMQQDDYWRLTKLRQAWSLGFGAARTDPTPAPIAIAVLDQGFKSEPVDLVWDYVIGKKEHMDQAAPEPFPWHGTHCGSLLGASVNNEKSAAGSSLFGQFSNFPKAPPFPRVRYLPAVLPPGPVFFPDVADLIRASIMEGAAIISMSHRFWCGFFCNIFGEEQDLLQALEAAAEQRVAVVFAAGNDGVELPNNSPWAYLVGCQRNGKALCIGAVNRYGVRMHSSNKGEKVVTFGPGHNVAIAALPSGSPNEEQNAAAFSGTSAAAPFLAGIIAFAETVWGERLSNEELRPLLVASSQRRARRSGEQCVLETVEPNVPVLDASAFLRKKLVVARDMEEPNEQVADVKDDPPIGPSLDATYTLDAPADVDLLPLTFGNCQDATIEVNYVRDNEHQLLAASLLDEQGQVVTTEQEQDKCYGVLKVRATKLKPTKRHYLSISNGVSPTYPEPALAKAYDFTVTPANCGP